MLRVVLATAVAVVASIVGSDIARAAPIAALPEAVTSETGNVTPAYYYHRRYYPYRWHGHYYGHRYWRYHRWHYY